MLRTLLAYARGVGVDARWVVIDGDPTSSRSPSASTTSSTARPATAARSAPPSAPHYEDDPAPQRRGAARARPPRRHRAPARPPDRRARAAALARAGATVVWRCHVGARHTNEHTSEAGRSSAPTSSTSTPTCSHGGVRTARGPTRDACRHPAVDRPVLGEEPADRGRRRRASCSTSACSAATAPRRPPSARGRVAGPDRPPCRHPPDGPATARRTRRSSSRSRGGTA